jgi:prepilin-type N-terminal cleavage/methylation domain-containing protein
VPTKPHGRTPETAFSLVEMLVVIAVIGILSGLAVSQIQGGAQQARMAVARQQQMEVQTALDAWIVAQSSGTAGLAGAQAAYSADAGAMLSAISPYLRDPGIFSASGGGLTSEALSGIGKSLQFSAWSGSGSPKVLLQ